MKDIIIENTSTHFECEIENLYHATIEREIARYFNMGYPDNSSIPLEIEEGFSDKCILRCTKKSGEFYINSYKLKNEKYLLSASLSGKLHNV